MALGGFGDPSASDDWLNAGEGAHKRFQRDFGYAGCNSRSDTRQRRIARGRINAVRAAFKAGVTLTTVMDVATNVTSKGFAAEHAELHHYTTFDGLSGIYKSKTMWATNYRDLNDAKEVYQVYQLRGALVEVLTVRFNLLLTNYYQRNERVRRAIDETGGGVTGIAADQASRMVSAFYDTIARNSAPLDPYIVSFCTHAADDYARQHGLLSQWRGYGGGGGYCLVFETQKLIDLLKLEFAAHYWVMSPRLDQVRYHTDSLSIDAVFGPLLEETNRLLSAIIENTKIPEIVWRTSFGRHHF